MAKFDKCPWIYWNNKTKIEYLQRRIIVYSIMYYEYDESCISDFEYDSLSKELVRLMKLDELNSKKTRYYYVFYDFDGSTGFYITSRLKEEDYEQLSEIANIVHTKWKENKK